MTESKKAGFMEIIKSGLSQLSKLALANIFPSFSSIAESSEKIMKNIEDRMMRVEKRILRKISYFSMIGVGAIFLVLAIFSFLTEFLLWSNASAYFSIGITVFVAGLLLKIGDSD